MKQKKSKSISTRIMIVVSLAIILTSTISLTVVLNGSKKQLSKTTKNSMMTMANVSKELVEEAIVKNDGNELEYDVYESLIGELKLQDIDSSYVYVVDEKGTMLFHPTKDKVGKPVENEVVKGLVEQLNKGLHPADDVTSYEFKGVIKYAAYSILSNNDILVISADEKEVFDSIKRITVITVILIFISVVLASVIAFVIGKIMVKPVVKLTEIIKNISEGDIHANFEGVKDSNDEIGNIGTAMRNMVGSLDTFVEQIRDTSSKMVNNSIELSQTSDQTLSANGEISKAIEEVADGTTQTSTSLVEISDCLAHISEETQTISQSVVDIARQTEAVQDNSRNMRERVQKMYQGSQELDESIHIISAKIQQVNEVVDRVRDIVDVIEVISGQTNLLSLNASIEAARAGEAGRGFTVVANEIRTLSENTKQELNNIRDIIELLVSECKSCVQESDEVVSKNIEQKMELNWSSKNLKAWMSRLIKRQKKPRRLKDL